jgi:hypothetical protein
LVGLVGLVGTYLGYKGGFYSAVAIGF